MSNQLAVGIAVPVGSGKTALMDCLHKDARRRRIAAITNDIDTREDAESSRARAPCRPERIRGRDRGCPHTAIRERLINLAAVAE